MIVEKSQTYSSLSETQQAKWGFPKPRALRRKVSPLFFAIQGKTTPLRYQSNVEKKCYIRQPVLLITQPLSLLVLWEFQQTEGRLPQSSSQEDMDTVLRQRDEKLKAAEVDPTFVDDHLLQYVLFFFWI